MTGRIFRSIMTVGLVVLVLCMVLIMGVLYQYYDSRLTGELQAKTGYIAAGVEQEGADYLARTQGGADRVTWIAADGTVIYDSQALIDQMENHADRDEVRQAMETGSGMDSRYSNTMAEKQVYYALRLSDGTVLRVSNSQHTVWTLMVSMLRPMIIAAALTVLVSLGLASRLSRQILRPVNAMDLEHPEEAECYDELAPLLRKLSSQKRTIARQMNELRRKQQEFAAITENMSEGFLVVDGMKNLLSYNTSALKLLNADEPQGETVSVLTLNRSESFRRGVELALAGQHCEQPLQLNGRFYRLVANPVYEEGALAGAVLVILDVTEEEEREALRRQFTANVSHELKTPLTSILGTSEMLRSGVVKPEDVPHFASNIYKETSRLIDLVADIIRLSQLDEGALSAQPVAVDLYQVGESVLQRLGDQAAQREVTASLAGSTAVVTAVPQILEELVYNLCDNAIQYNRPQGTVTLTTELREGRPTLMVADTGIGIPPEHQNRVFERFYRVDQSHSKRGGGTGLGLSIVKHAASACGGELTLESRVGEGTVITVTFPPEVKTE